MEKLIIALHKVISVGEGIELKTSGNILNRVRSVDEEVAITLADVYYHKRAKEKEVFDKGLNFALKYKNKNSFYRIVITNYVLYFVGTEAEIIKKITEKLEEKKGKEEDIKESIVNIE